MNAALDRNLFFVREHVGMFKAANNYDILDPDTGEEILHCREPELGSFTKLLRFTDYKRMTPFDVRITTPDGQPVFQVTRGIYSNSGRTCLPISSRVCMTCSCEILKGLTRQRSTSAPVAS